MTETVLYLIIAVLAAVILVLAFRLHVLRQTFKEIDRGLTERLDTDTNTLVTVSGLDRYSRKLASDINKEIARLRKEQNSYAAKNDEIKTAVTNIAHDIRTPLTAINGYLELFEKAELEPRQQRWMAVIRERTDNLKELAEELFSYSVAYSEAENLRLERLNLNDELAESLAGFYGAFKAVGIEPEIDICGTPVFRKADRKAFGRIVSNLLNNALRYSAGDLAVSLDESGCITFSNRTGDITQNDVERLFERFYTVRTAKGSTGLGLSIARMLTERMRGSISAELTDNYLKIKVEFPKI